MVDAMHRQGRSGIGQVIFSGKQQLALVRPVDKLLSMAMLNYAAEINSPEKMEHDFKSPKQKDRQLKLAEQLVQGMSSDDFDVSRYEDTYRDKLEKLIASKVKGHKVVVAKETKSEPATINLMDALKKSVAHSRRSQKALAARTRKSRTA
jgi:DNA end-binding protein Ku